MLPRSLEGLERNAASAAARGALSAILALTANSQLQGLESSTERLIADLARATKIDLHKPIDESARTKLLSAASETLNSVLIGERSRNELKAWAGNRGLLKISDYKIQFPPTDWTEFGLDRGLVTLTVSSPHAYQHLLPESAPKDQQQLLSVFVRHLGKKGDGQRRWCMAVASRKGDTLSVMQAFLVFEDDLEIDPAIGRPIDMLRSFVRKFGREIFSEGRLLGKFVENEIVNYGDNVDMIWIPGDTKRGVQQVVVGKLDSKTMTNSLAFAFAIDVGAYQDGLESRGVKFSKERG